MYSLASAIPRVGRPLPRPLPLSVTTTASLVRNPLPLLQMPAATLPTLLLLVPVRSLRRVVLLPPPLPARSMVVQTPLTAPPSAPRPATRRGSPHPHPPPYVRVDSRQGVALVSPRGHTAPAPAATTAASASASTASAGITSPINAAYSVRW